MLSLSLSIINLYARDIFNKKLINKSVDTKHRIEQITTENTHLMARRLLMNKANKSIRISC